MTDQTMSPLRVLSDLGLEPPIWAAATRSASAERRGERMTEDIDAQGGDMTTTATSPIQALTDMGVRLPAWAADKEPTVRDGRQRWTYTTRYLATNGLVSIAHLVATGEWKVNIDSLSHGLLISITRKETR